MALSNCFRKSLLATSAVIPALLLSAVSASAEVFEFACQPTMSYRGETPITTYYRVDDHALTVTDLAGTPATYPATITPVSIDWFEGSGGYGEKYHVERLSGVMSRRQSPGNYGQDFSCHKTSGF